VTERDHAFKSAHRGCVSKLS